MTLQSQRLSPATREPSTSGIWEGGWVSPPGSLSQNPEDPALPLTTVPSPAAKRNSPEVSDAVTVGKPYLREKTNF